MTASSGKIEPPARRSLVREARVALDMASMVAPLIGAQLRPRRDGEGRPVLVVPGFGSDDRYTAPMRHFLNCHGYQAEGWGMGKNRAGVDLPHQLSDLSDRWEVSPRTPYRGEASVPYLCDRLTERVRRRHQQIGRPISLIGWSLGGYLAREVARDLPEAVDRVITMGSPTIGGPKYTAAAGFFRRRGMDLDWIEAEIAKRESRPIRQPITAIVSKSDAIVSWRAAMDGHSEDVTHIEVNAAHLGMGFNPTIWRHILLALSGGRSG